MIRAIAIDDEPPALDILASYCKKTDLVQLDKTFTGPSAALEYLDRFPVDLLFLDINMPSLSGIDLYKQIRQQPMVIFTTSYSEYAVESYNLNAVDYLLKPFTFERFLQAVEKAVIVHRQQQAEGRRQWLVLRADYSLFRIALPDILFIEGLDNYLKIHLSDQQPVVVRMTMKALQEKLPASEFARVHRSYIVPLRKIQAVRNKLITIADKEIPLGTSYEKEFLALFDSFHP